MFTCLTSHYKKPEKIVSLTASAITILSTKQLQKLCEKITVLQCIELCMHMCILLWYLINIFIFIHCCLIILVLSETNRTTITGSLVNFLNIPNCFNCPQLGSTGHLSSLKYNAEDRIQKHHCCSVQILGIIKRA